MYYVYIHKEKETGLVVYAGKGSNHRYKDFGSRSKEHNIMMKQGKLDYIILKNFDDELEAYEYEETVTYHYKSIGQCRLNISIGRRTSNETKVKLSHILKGRKRSKETRELMKKNHTQPLAKEVLLYKKGKLINTFISSRAAGRYAVENGICSYGWCGRSLLNKEETQPTKNFPSGGYLFVYKDDSM